MDQLILELEAAVRRLSAIIQTFDFFLKFPLPDNFTDEIQKLKGNAERKRDIRRNALQALISLRDDGFPDSGRILISKELRLFIRETIAGLTEALGEFYIDFGAVKGRFIINKESKIDELLINPETMFKQ